MREEGVEGKEGAQKEETERKFRLETLSSTNKKEGFQGKAYSGLIIAWKL